MLWTIEELWIRRLKQADYGLILLYYTLAYRCDLRMARSSFEAKATF